MLSKLKIFYDFFLLRDYSLSKYETGLLILIALCFSIAIRLYYPSLMYSNQDFLYKGVPIINSSDGFWYAKGALDRINEPEVANPQSPTYKSVSIITEYLYRITPFSLEELIFFIPLLSSIIVIPLVLIGKEMGNPLLGFSVALASSVAGGFYVRTIAGYYDDDFFTLTLPFLLLYFIVATLAKKDRNDTTLLLGIATIFFYHWWYQNGPIIITGLLATMFFVTLLFYRRNEKAWMFMILGFMANLKVAFLLKLFPVVGIYIAWRVVKAKRSDKLKWFYTLSFIIAGLLFINSGLFVELVMKFDSYISKDFTSQATSGYGLNYFNSLQTVAESKAVSFEEFFKMIAWKEWIFIFGTIGYLLAALRYPFLWVAFPMYFIGLSAADAGMRFTAYGSPVVFLGAGYLVYLAGDIISRIYRLKFIYPLVGFILMLYPLQYSYSLMKSITPPSALTSLEAFSMTAMSQIADRKDYIISWWDFGYPIRYYADVKTHSDGGSQNGTLTYMESLALSSESPALAYNLLRDGIEIREAGLGGEGTFGAIMKHSKMGETPKASEMIEKLKSSDYETYEKTRNIYWMMMHRMLPIYATIRAFSDYDLQTNEITNNGFYIFSPTGSEEDRELKLTDGIVFDKIKGVIRLPDGSEATVKQVIRAQEVNKEVKTERIDINPNGALYLIHMLNTNGFVIVDERELNSNFVQMFVLGKYNPEYFEPVMINPLIKVYRLREKVNNSATK